MSRVLGWLLAGGVLVGTQRPDPWQRKFPVDKRELASSGRSSYVTLEPGYVQVLESGAVRLVITVLDQTRQVDGVETRIVEERESEHGRLVEVSRNYFAIHPPTGDLYYFGESVDLYRGGKVVGHAGSWLAGSQGARFGLMLPGHPVLGARYYQEIAPGLALDRAEVVSLSDSLTTPAGRFSGCLRILETTPLEPGARESKLYAPGVGLVQDGELKLVRQGPRAL